MCCPVEDRHGTFLACMGTTRVQRVNIRTASCYRTRWCASLGLKRAEWASAPPGAEAPASTQHAGSQARLGSSGAHDYSAPPYRGLGAKNGEPSRRDPRTSHAPPGIFGLWLGGGTLRSRGGRQGERNVSMSRGLVSNDTFEMAWAR